MRRQGEAPARDIRSDESGFALVVIVLMMALLVSLGAVGARTAQIELRIASNDLRSKQALESAEAGLEHAFALLRAEVGGVNAATNGFDDELASGGTGGGLTPLGALRTLDDGNLYRCNQLSEQSGDDGYCVRMIDNQDETAGLNDPTVDIDNTVYLVSRGTVSKARRTVELRIERDPVHDCVLCANLDFPLLPADIALIGGFSTDSYDSRLGPYAPMTAGDGGNIRSNGSVTMTGAILLPIDIDGSVTATRDVLTLLPPVSVSGATTEFAAPASYPPVSPCGPPYPSNDGITGGLYDRNTGILINVGLGDVIRLEGGTPDEPREYCFSAVLMTGISRLQVDGPVHIRLTAVSTILGIVNTTNVPGNLRISSSVDQPLPFLPVNPGLVLGAVGGDISAVVYAPNAMVAFVGVVNNFYGQMVTGIPAAVGVSANMHFDEALFEAGLHRRGWRELRNHPPT